MPVDSVQKQEGRDARGRFERGRSGNPKGRRPGARNCTGAITPGEAAELARVEEIFVRAVETGDFERRLQQKERRYGTGA